MRVVIATRVVAVASVAALILTSWNFQKQDSWTAFGGGGWGENEHWGEVKDGKKKKGRQREINENLGTREKEKLTSKWVNKKLIESEGDKKEKK